MARVYAARRAATRRHRALLPASRRRRPRAGLEELRQDRARLQRRLLGPPLRAAAAAGAPVPEPGRAARRPAAHRAQHDGELRHEHELAVLRRRVHDVVPDPDGRAARAELRLGGGRDGGARRRRPRPRAPVGEGARATSGSTSTARSSTSCCRWRWSWRSSSSRRASPQTFRGHATATTLEGATQTIARGPVALA